MTQLIVYRSDYPISVESNNERTYLYRIGGGSVGGRDFVELNDAVRLNKVAEDLRDDYCEWIFSLNRGLFKNRLTIDRLSLFFLTDLSCKRTEFFDTYDTICNLVLIRDLLVGIDISSAELIGVDKGFVCGFQSIFPTTKIIEKNLGHPATTKKRRFFSDLWYLFRLAGVALSNGRIIGPKGNHESTKKTLYFSYYPQMFLDDGRDTKYGDLVTEDNRYAVSIVTDGIHQNAGILQYLKSRKRIESEDHIVIDRFVRFIDCFWGFYWVIRCQWFLFTIRKNIFLFNNIDISGVMASELYFSMSRIARLCAISRAFLRFFQSTDITEFIYYPHEYPFGRMISYAAKITRPEMHRRGYQMGPVSERRMEVFMADGEARQHPPFFRHAPIPDSVAAEDDSSAEIYRRCGYENVEVMDRIYRYSHIDNLDPERRKGWVLLVPGLHDVSDIERRI